MPLQATSGAASQDAFGGNGVAVVPTYIEDVFSTYLYTGTGAAQTITNGVDLSTKGGLVWLKGRSGATDHALYDTARGATFDAASNLTTAPTTQATGLTAFGTTGFSIGALAKLNTNSATYASWTFRKQPKFFDVVTFTKSTANLSVSHSLGSIPACVIIKATNIADEWYTYHRSLTSTNYNLNLNRTNAQSDNGASWISLTSTTVDLNTGLIPADGNTYVMYLFAHDAGGFGLTGTDNVISCGSFTTNGSGAATVNLGYEPQWVMTKIVSDTGNWVINDNMRGMPASQTSQVLYPNLTAAESSSIYFSTQPNATGFTTTAYANNPSQTVIYIAIRRGPMKVPTTGTSVFAPVNQTGGGTVTTNFPVDLVIATTPSQSSYRSVNDRLRGGRTTRGVELYTNVTNAEAVGSFGFGFDNNTGYIDGLFTSSFSDLYLNFRRAPSFFDEICYTGTGSARTVSHNLQAVPQLIITKVRSSAGYGWFVYPLDATKYMELNSTSAAGVTSSAWNDTAPTASVFTVGAADQTNLSGATLVAYLFATCAGVSKVGSYTGTAATLQIDCGFTGGARFVLIKRTDSTGAWYVWDTARGIVSGNDPYLLLNSTAAEVTNTDYIDTYSAGFEISSTAPAAINASGGTYIFLAIA
jgi:hypothetical protein